MPGWLRAAWRWAENASTAYFVWGCFAALAAGFVVPGGVVRQVFVGLGVFFGVFAVLLFGQAAYERRRARRNRPRIEVVPHGGYDATLWVKNTGGSAAIFTGVGQLRENGTPFARKRPYDLLWRSPPAGTTNRRQIEAGGEGVIFLGTQNDATYVDDERAWFASGDYGNVEQWEFEPASSFSMADSIKYLPSKTVRMRIRIRSNPELDVAFERDYDVRVTGGAKPQFVVEEVRD